MICKLGSAFDEAAAALHQNFPGQFRQLAPYLMRAGHELKAICSHDRPVMPGVDVLRYCSTVQAFRTDEPESAALV